MITPDTPDTDAGATGNTLTVPKGALEIDGVAPEVGDRVDLSQAEATVTAVDGDRITVRVEAVNGEALTAPADPDPETDVMREAIDADERMRY